MLDQTLSAALATTLLRVSLGTVFLAHGVVLKLFTFGLPGTAAFFRTCSFASLCVALHRLHPRRSGT